MKAKKCKLVVVMMNRQIRQPIHFPSIKKAIEYTKEENGGFAYTLFTEDDKHIRSGYCGKIKVKK